MADPFKADPDDWEKVRLEAGRHGGPFNCILDNAARIAELTQQLEALGQRIDEALATPKTAPADPPFTHPEPGTISVDITKYTHDAFVNMLWAAVCTADNGVRFMDFVSFQQAAADIRDHTLRCEKKTAQNTPPEAAPSEASPPLNCLVRLIQEGKPYPRGHCYACGQFAPNQFRCKMQLESASSPQPSFDLKAAIVAATDGLIGRVYAARVLAATVKWLKAEGLNEAARVLEEHL